jgi:hypothetical protein
MEIRLRLSSPDRKKSRKSVLEQINEMKDKPAFNRKKMKPTPFECLEHVVQDE